MLSKLRSGSRKDSKKLALSEREKDTECVESDEAITVFDEKEVVSTEEKNESSETPDDEELEELQEKLESMLVARKKLEKKMKKHQLSERITALLNQNKKDQKKHNQKNIKGKRRESNIYSSCSSEDSHVVDSSDSDLNNDSSEEDTRRSRHKKKRSKSRNKKSGKSSKVTSKVKYPQEWPHAHLSLHFVNKLKKYDELSIQEFCAGYCSILDEVNDNECKHRVQHLRELMYLSTIYQWECILSYHAAVLLEIERGHFRWGDSFQTLQMTTLAGGVLLKAGDSSRANETGPVVFCKNYQRGMCDERSDHYGDYNGLSRLLRHICAICWLDSHKKSPHPEFECHSRAD